MRREITFKNWSHGGNTGCFSFNPVKLSVWISGTLLTVTFCPTRLPALWRQLRVDWFMKFLYLLWLSGLISLYENLFQRLKRFLKRNILIVIISCSFGDSKKTYCQIENYSGNYFVEAKMIKWSNKPWNLYKHPRWSRRLSSDLYTGESSRKRWITISNTWKHNRSVYKNNTITFLTENAFSKKCLLQPMQPRSAWGTYR